MTTVQLIRCVHMGPLWLIKWHWVLESSQIKRWTWNQFWSWQVILFFFIDVSALHWDMDVRHSSKQKNDVKRKWWHVTEWTWAGSLHWRRLLQAFRTQTWSTPASKQATSPSSVQPEGKKCVFNKKLDRIDNVGGRRKWQDPKSSTSTHTNPSKTRRNKKKMKHNLPSTGWPNLSLNTQTTVTVNRSLKHTKSQQNVGAEVHVSLLSEWPLTPGSKECSY